MKLEGEVLNEVETVIKKKSEQEFKKLGSYRPTIDGYKIWEYDMADQILREAEFKESDIYIIGGDNTPKLYTKPGCIYIEALNIDNAVKRLKKGKFIFKS